MPSNTINSVAAPDNEARGRRDRCFRPGNEMKSRFAVTLEMLNWRSIRPVVVSLTAVAVTTVCLLQVNVYPEPQHLIFGYLVPTAFVAIRYGSVLAMLVSIASNVSAAYFLYPPKFSIYITNPLHFGELMFFFILALAASQIISALTNDLNVEKRRAGFFFQPGFSGGELSGREASAPAPMHESFPR
jgi:K+-sensing histidine kinase KdpD